MTDRTALFGVDPRSLACFRIGLALLVLADLATRAPDLRAMYTDAGVAPRVDMLAQFGFLYDAAFAVHFGASGPLWVGVLFAIEAAAAVALLVGWRARTAAGVAFVLVSGLQLRNLYIGAGYDALLRMMLLWSAFAPTAAAWSVDARGAASPREPLRDVGSLAIVGQVVLVYLATGYAKAQVDAWSTGQALSLHLAADFHATGFGRWLARFPVACAALTRITLWTELLWPLALLVPVARGPIRTVAVWSVMALTLAFWLGIDVDLFPWAGAVSLTACLPAWFWDRVEPATDRVASALEPVARALEGLPRGAPPGPKLAWASQIVAAALFAWVAVWNVGVARDPAYAGPSVAGGVGRALFLQQGWAMFARPATRSGWVAVEGRTVGGSPVDLMRWGGPVPRVSDPAAIAPGPGGVPELPSAIYRSGRWRLLLKRIAYRDVEGAARGYSRYLCREWNAEHAGAARLDTLEIAFFHRPVPSAPDAPYQRELVWEHGCYR